MKKITNVLCLLLLGFFFIPNVFADELPQEGVHYFLTYPNGEEEVIANYQEANNPKEKLLYTGRTNQNGEILLEGWANEGQLRIVQKVPNGFSTVKEQYTVDLAKDTTVEFVDFRSTNPKTGRSLIFLVILAVAVVGASLVVKKDKKKLMVIIPVLALGVVAYQVYAANNFKIIVKDKAGNRLAGVEVSVYAKPISVSAAPAVIIKANGGHFFDGKTEIYLKLPHDGCNFSDVVNALSEDEYNEYELYMETVARDGYYPNYPTFPAGPLHDGDAFSFTWERSDYANIVKIDGNGGVVEVNGRVVSSLDIYEEDFYYSSYYFTNGDKTFIGFDEDPSCSNYDEFGVQKNESLLDYYYNNLQKRKTRILPETVYACWSSKPDGIYVNGQAFIGNVDSCYNQAEMDVDDNGFELNSGYKAIDFYEYDGTFYIEIPRNTTPKPNGSDAFFREIKAVGVPFVSGYDEIHSVEIVENGVVVLSVSEDELEYTGYGYIVTDSDKSDYLQDYMHEIMNHCYRD